MRYRIALISDEPIDIRSWPFEEIEIYTQDKTYIIIDGTSTDLRNLFHLLAGLLPSTLQGMAMTIQENRVLH